VCSGREFQVWAAATGKARLPTVASLTGGTTRQLVRAERRALRPGTRGGRTDTDRTNTSGTTGGWRHGCQTSFAGAGAVLSGQPY